MNGNKGMMGEGSHGEVGCLESGSNADINSGRRSYVPVDAKEGNKVG